MKISFIGFGNIAKAIAAGLLQNEGYELRAASPSLTVGINNQGIRTYSDNLAVVPDTDILILAVKPAQIDVVLTQIRTILPPHCLIISVAAGLSLTWFANRSPNTAVLRAMPNIAASIGLSATPLIANEFVTETQKQCAEQIFTRLGLITWATKESDIDAFTALSGSGPAYIFMFMDAMIKAAIDLGLADDVAKSFTLQTFHGALNVASESKLNLVELRKKVTSPAGTTAAAIEVLTEHGFNDLIFDAMKAACERARALGR